MWSGNADLSKHTAPILSALVLGTFLNGLMWMPYQLQLAYGWTGLALRVNIVAVIVLIPAIFWVVPRFGAVGAARIWVALNATYIVVAVQLMHRRLIPAEKWRWYFADLLLPVSGSVGVMLVARQLQPVPYQDRLRWLVFLLSTGILAIVISTILAALIRRRIISVAPSWALKKLQRAD